MKLSIEFDGWHCLSKKDRKNILVLARENFKNSNLFGQNALIIDDINELKILEFCLKILEEYKNVFGSWNGYTIKKISQRIIYNYQDKKRKLNLDYFKKLIKNSEYNDIRTVLAGTLYMGPDDIRTILYEVERKIKFPLKEMNDSDLEKAYNILLNYSSILVRRFSLT